jgi:DnaJ-class molecular chaperone
MTFTEQEAARQILGLGERATLGEIKSRHKALVKRHHPGCRQRRRASSNADPARCRHLKLSGF